MLCDACVHKLRRKGGKQLLLCPLCSQHAERIGPRRRKRHTFLEVLQKTLKMSFKSKSRRIRDIISASTPLTAMVSSQTVWRWRMTAKKVVVVGAGFGGLTFCEHFFHPDALVTVVDRTNHHLFQPLLYQVAMAGLSGPDIAQPIRSILSKQPNLQVLLDEVKDFDLAHKRVLCGNKTLAYDYLVLALGSVTSYFGHADWAEYAPVAENTGRRLYDPPQRAAGF